MGGRARVWRASACLGAARREVAGIIVGSVYAVRMCTRFTLHRGKQAVEAAAKALGIALANDLEVTANYNVALTQSVPVFAGASGYVSQVPNQTEGGGPALRGVSLVQQLWGFLPFYERGKTPARLLPNARAEGARQSAAFREAVVRRRCVVPADGFYEWQTKGKHKEALLFELADGEPFAFAGIWEPGGNETLDTFAVLTTSPNERVAHVHDRMPVILRGKAIERWLGGCGKALDDEVYEQLVAPLHPDLMRERRLGPFVNSVRNNGPRCHEAPGQVCDGSLQGELF